MKKRKIRIRVSMEAIDKLKQGVFITVSDDSRGWKWIMEEVRKVTGIREGTCSLPWGIRECSFSQNT